jgi:hypothetical protein
MPEGKPIRRELKRTVQFFATRLTELEGDDLITSPDQEWIWKDLAARPYRGEEKKGRCRPLGSDFEQAIRIQKTAEGVYRGRIHRDNLIERPLLGKEEIEKALVLPDGENPRHPTHFIWWNLERFPEKRGGPSSKQGLLAAEFSPAGPRANSLRDYVYDRFDGRRQLEILPLVDKEIWNTLAEGKLNIRNLEMKVLYDRKDFSQGIGGLNVPRAISGTKEVTVTFKPQRKHGLRFLPRGINWAKEALADGSVLGLTIELESGERINLEDAYVKEKVTVVKMRTGNSVDPGAMYGEIERVHGELLDQILLGMGRSRPDVI